MASFLCSMIGKLGRQHRGHTLVPPYVHSPAGRENHKHKTDEMKTYLGLKCLIVLSAVGLFSDTGLQCAAITVIPNVAVALINDSTYYNCSTTSEKVEWLFSSDENLQQSVIYSYGAVKPHYQDRFRVEKYANNTGKQFNLFLQSVAKDDAGRYICRDPDSNEEGEAQLIVLDSQPFCESNLNVDGLIGPNSCAIKQESVHLSCSVRYSGNQFPELQWIKTDENIAISSSKCSDSGNVNTCNLTMESELQMDGSSYICQTTQSMTKQYNCTSGVFRIIYAFGERTERIGNINDKVNCSVNFISQSCTYSWIFDDGTTNRTESHDPVIELKGPGRFICEANCLIRDINCIFTAMTVNVNVDSVNQGDGNTNVIAIIVVIVVIVAVIGIIVFILWKKRRQTGANRQQTPEEKSLVPDVRISDKQEPPKEESVALNVENTAGAVEKDNIPRTITPMADENCNRRVRGLTVLNDELFVVFDMSSMIEVSPINFREPYRKLMVDDLMDPGTIAACVKHNCLYIVDQKRKDPRKKIFRVNPDGTVMKTLDTDHGDEGRISVNRDGNIVMTVYGEHTCKLKLYSSEGKLLTERTIDFSDTSITYIFHAINLSDGNFIISHGVDTDKSRLHRVCKIDSKGNVLQSFGKEKGSDEAHLSSPAYLAERNDGSILVADQGNHRIVLLNSDLEFETVLFTKENGKVSRPDAIYIYEKTEPALLFLGCNETSNAGGYVLVLGLEASTKQDQLESDPMSRSAAVQAGEAVAGNMVLRIITPTTNKNDDRRVRGLAILDDELFVAFEKSSIIEVFPVNSHMSSHKSVVIKDLFDPGTIAGCAENSCLYIIDQIDSTKKKMFRVKPDGEVINTWETNDEKGRISVSRDGNIVMTVQNKDKLKIYSPEGDLLTEKTIDFTGTPITYIFHAINLADGNFIISHGIHKSNVHQVCKIDATGKLLRSFGNKKGSGDAQLNCPAYVAERKDESILVADRDNDRIILLNSELKFVKELFTKDKHGVRLPGFMFVYEDTDTPLLFLGCNKTLNSGGYVLVLKLGQ